MKFNEFKQLFLDLTKVTVPHGSEYLYYNGVMKQLLDFELTQRGENFYYVVGDGSSKTLFCSHLDTAGDPISKKVTHGFHNSMIYTKSDTVLGADNKAGVAAMIYLINKGVEGTYYFFAGEEMGRIGSIDARFRDSQFFSHFDRAISFDRRGKGSIVSHQMGELSCSSSFVEALAKEYEYNEVKMSGDSTGLYTDTYSFLPLIEECTNISIGFTNEHSTHEYINIDYAYSVARASSEIDWDSLPVDREPTNNRWDYGYRPTYPPKEYEFLVDADEDYDELLHGHPPNVL